MAARRYHKAQAAPDAQAFFADLTRIREIVADFTSRYSPTEVVTSAAAAGGVTGPKSVVALVEPEVRGLMQERMYVLALNTRNAVIDLTMVYQGTLNASSLRVAELFRPAILASAASIIVIHNHPTGDPTPSPDDVRTTQMIKDAGELLDVEQLDHVIIGTAERFVSLKERGLGFSAGPYTRGGRR